MTADPWHDLAGLRVLVTGAAHGIGLEVARHFIGVGASVAVTDVAEDIGRLGESMGAVSSHRADIAEAHEVEAMVADAVGALGGLDCLVNVAGLQRVGNLVTFDLDDWDAMMRVNLRGVFLTCRAATPPPACIVTRDHHQHGLHCGIARRARRHCLRRLQRRRHRLYDCFGAGACPPQHLRQFRVSLGWVDTGFNDPIIGLVGGADAHERLVIDGVPLRRQASAQELAPTYLFLASAGARYITAKSISVDGGVLS
jgi:NAD(P)-dependent dehydrogenase (short-subunit alcohol dehydrogenase family)